MLKLVHYRKQYIWTNKKFKKQNFKSVSKKRNFLQMILGQLELFLGEKRYWTIFPGLQIFTTEEDSLKAWSQASSLFPHPFVSWQLFCFIKKIWAITNLHPSYFSPNFLFCKSFPIFQDLGAKKFRVILWHPPFSQIS